MSATLRRRCADIPSAGSRCKGTTFFSFVQDVAQKNCHACQKAQMAILSQS